MTTFLINLPEVFHHVMELPFTEYLIRERAYVAMGSLLAVSHGFVFRFGRILLINDHANTTRDQHALLQRTQEERDAAIRSNVAHSRRLATLSEQYSKHLTEKDDMIDGLKASNLLLVLEIGRLLRQQVQKQMEAEIGSIKKLTEWNWGRFSLRRKSHHKSQ